jgi:MFS family permease
LAVGPIVVFMAEKVSTQLLFVIGCAFIFFAHLFVIIYSYSGIIFLYLAGIFGGFGAGMVLTLTIIIVLDEYGSIDSGKVIGFLLLGFSIGSLIFSKIVFQHFYYVAKNPAWHTCHVVACFRPSFIVYLIASFIGLLCAIASYIIQKKEDDAKTKMKFGLGFSGSKEEAK